MVCGITLWDEDVTYDFSLSNWRSGFKSTWGHRWIEYPGGSAGFWPGVRPSDPVSSVPGRIQQPDPNAAVPHSNFTQRETYFSVTSPNRCRNCDETVKCIANFARSYTCSYSLGINNCRSFADQALGTCGLTTIATSDQLFTDK